MAKSNLWKKFILVSGSGGMKVHSGRTACQPAVKTDSQSSSEETTFQSTHIRRRVSWERGKTINLKVHSPPTDILPPSKVPDLPRQCYHGEQVFRCTSLWCILLIQITRSFYPVTMLNSRVELRNILKTTWAFGRRFSSVSLFYVSECPLKLRSMVQG